jgi:hypothetical protein
MGKRDITLRPRKKVKLEDLGIVAEDGVYEWKSGAPAWVIEGFIADTITQVGEMMAFAADPDAKSKLSPSRRVRVTLLSLYKNLESLHDNFEQANPATLSPKHKTIAACVGKMLPHLQRVGLAHEAAGPDNENAAIESAVAVSWALSALHRLASDKTDRKEWPKIMSEVAAVAETH